MKTSWRTLWQQQAIVVYRDEVEVDRIAADQIARIFLLYRDAGDSPGDIDTSVVEFKDEAEGFALFEARTGFAGRVNFERREFWQARACVYWVPAAGASLPWRLRLAGWRGDGAGRAYRRVARAEFESCLERWLLQPPQTWEERKQSRLERSRPFGAAGVWKDAA
jgi:hypothetical protein